MSKFKVMNYKGCHPENFTEEVNKFLETHKVINVSNTLKTTSAVMDDYDISQVYICYTIEYEE